MDTEDRALLLRLVAQNDALAAQVHALRVERAPARRAATTCWRLLVGWAKVKEKLPSFACDLARGWRVLGFVPGEGEYPHVALGARDPVTLTAVDVDLFRSWCYGQETRRGAEPRPATVNRHVMMLKRTLNFGVERKLIESNPLEGLEDDDEDNVREVIIDEAGFARICEHISNPIALAYVTLAYDSAMRRTEVLLCRWSWLDGQAGFVRVPSAVAKNGEGRTADLSPRAAALLKALPRAIGSEHVFVNPDTGALFDPRWLYELYRRAVVDSGVRGPNGEIPTFHDLRRSWITLAGRRGIPEAVWMSKSGHKDHAVVKRYRIVVETELRRAWETMEAARLKEISAIGTTA